MHWLGGALARAPFPGPWFSSVVHWLRGALNAWGGSARCATSDLRCAPRIKRNGRVSEACPLTQSVGNACPRSHPSLGNAAPPSHTCLGARAPQHVLAARVSGGGCMDVLRDLVLPRGWLLVPDFKRARCTSHNLSPVHLKPESAVCPFPFCVGSGRAWKCDVRRTAAGLQGGPWFCQARCLRLSRAFRRGEGCFNCECTAWSFQRQPLANRAHCARCWLVAQPGGEPVG